MLKKLAAALVCINCKGLYGESGGYEQGEGPKGTHGTELGKFVYTIYREGIKFSIWGYLQGRH